MPCHVVGAGASGSASSFAIASALIEALSKLRTAPQSILAASAAASPATMASRSFKAV